VFGDNEKANTTFPTFCAGIVRLPLRIARLRQDGEPKSKPTMPIRMARASIPEIGSSRIWLEMPQRMLFGIALQERQTAYRQTVNAGFSIRDELFKVGFQFGQLPVEIDSHQVTSLFDPFDWLLKNVQF
jgi:hypothetical protein